MTARMGEILRQEEKGRLTTRRRVKDDRLEGWKVVVLTRQR